MAASRFFMEHEFDHEPTYVVDNDANDNARNVVTLDPHLPHALRRLMAEQIANQLNHERPLLLSDNELEKIAEGVN